MNNDLVSDLVEELVSQLVTGRPVIIDGFMVFTDGTIIQFTDDTIIFFGG